MIAQESITKLQTAVVYLAHTPGAGSPGLLLGADLTGMSQLIDFPEPLDVSPGQLVLSSMRNQFTATVSTGAVQLEDGSAEVPVRADFAERAAQVAEHIGTQSGHSYSAVGLNFAIEAEPADEALPPAAVLGRLVKRNALEDAGYEPIGASARFWYAARNRRYDLRVEPRGNQPDGRNYFAHLTVHMELTGDAPSSGWLSQALNEEYRNLIRILTDILRPL